VNGATYPIVFRLGFASYQIVSALADLSAEAELVADPVVIQFASADLSAQVDVVADADSDRWAQAPFSAQAQLVADPQAEFGYSADLSAAVDLVAQGTHIQFAEAEPMSAQVDLVADEPERIKEMFAALRGNWEPTLTVVPPDLFHIEPTYQDGLVQDWLFGRIRYTRGYTTIINNGVASLVTDPAQEDLATYDAYFLGGRRYQIFEDTVAILEASDLGDIVEVS
jgi:hypothetical protein